MKDPPQVPPGLTNVEKAVNLANRDDWTDGDTLLWMDLLAEREFTDAEARRLVQELQPIRVDRFVGVQLLLYRLGLLDFDLDAFVASPESDLAFVSSVCSWFRDYVSLSAAMIAWHRCLASDDEMAPWLRAGVHLALDTRREEVALLSAEDAAVHAAALERNPFKDPDEEPARPSPPRELGEARRWLEAAPPTGERRAFASAAQIQAAQALKSNDHAAFLEWASLAVFALEPAAGDEEQSRLRSIYLRAWIIEQCGVGDGHRDPIAVFDWVRKVAAGRTAEDLRRDADVVRRGHAEDRRNEVFAMMRSLYLIRHALGAVAKLASAGIRTPPDLLGLLAVRDVLP